MIVDFDTIATALGSKDSHEAPEAIRGCAFAAREAVIDHIFDGVDADAWIIHSRPKQEELDDYEAGGAEIVTLDPGLDECLRRMEADGRPSWNEEVIRDYYKGRPPRQKSTARSQTGGTLSAGGSMQTKTAPIGRVKAGPDDGLADGEFLVYPSTFTRTPDSYGDVVAAGAFADDIESWKSGDRGCLSGLFGHNMSDPDYNVAEALDMGEDDHGWWVKGRFDLDSPKAAQVYRLVKGRRLTQLSFAFDVLDSGAVELDDGTKANELRKLKVYEFSFVPVGANQDTSVVAVKALADAMAADLKAGRVLSAKNESALRTAYDALGDVLGAVDDEEKTPEKASEHGPSAKQASPEPPVTPPLDLIEAELMYIDTPEENHEVV